MIIKGQHQKGMGGARRSIKRQKKIFARKGVPGVELCFPATININTLPERYEVMAYDHFVEKVRHKLLPIPRKEDFGFIKIRTLKHNGIVYHNWGYLYFAHKSRYHNSDHMFELLGREIPGFHSNDELELEISDGLMRTLST